MLDSNGNGIHHEDDDDLFTDPGPILPDPAQMGADDGILLADVSFTSSPTTDLTRQHQTPTPPPPPNNAPQPRK